MHRTLQNDACCKHRDTHTPTRTHTLSTKLLQQVLQGIRQLSVLEPEASLLCASGEHLLALQHHLQATHDTPHAQQLAVSMLQAVADAPSTALLLDQSQCCRTADDSSTRVDQQHTCAPSPSSVVMAKSGTGSQLGRPITPPTALHNCAMVTGLGAVPL